MSVQHARPSSRRGFLGGLTFAGTAGFSWLAPQVAAAEPPPETTRIRVHHSLSLCLAPQYVAEELLRAEGFTEVHYVTHEEFGGLYEGLASGAADIGNDFAPMLIMHVDAGDPITISGRRARRLLRAVRNRAGPRHPGPEGEERRRPGTGITPARFPRQHGGVCGSGSRPGHQLGRAPPGRGHAAPRRRQDRCPDRVSARPAGAPGEADRAEWW